MSAGAAEGIGPLGVAFLFAIVAGWIFINSPLDGSMNLIVAGGFAVLAVGSLRGIQ